MFQLNYQPKYTYIPFYIFNKHLMLFDVSFNVIIGLLVYMHVFTVKFITELMQKLQIKKQFGTYLSPAMVEKLQKNPELLTLGGESRELSIMFTDVRGFTTISEHYGKDVQGLTKIMNRYMTAMTAKIIENGGTLDKYIGDAVMAFWGDPLKATDHGHSSTIAAVQMIKWVESHRDYFKNKYQVDLHIGIGINTGVVSVGNMGSSKSLGYTVIGDSVNLASRLEGATKFYGVSIIATESTFDNMTQTGHQWPQHRFIDLLKVKGKNEPVKIAQIFDEIAKVFADKCMMYEPKVVK